MHYAMNGEYAGFFDIGMVQRNEFNAIIVHGTMCLIRRKAIEDAGGWSSDTICEDTDLGLTLLELGWQAHYTNRRYGHGLLPDSFEAYKKQRNRWAYGGFQILKKHWRRFLPGASLLNCDQKREFALGWLNWLGAESIGVAVAILNVIWVPVVAFLDIAVPDKILTAPIIASFIVSLAHFATLYQLRVRPRAGQLLGSVFAAMSVQWTVARAVGFGVIKDRLPFVRTSKGGLRRTAELLIGRAPRIHWYSLYDLPRAWPATTRHREAEGSSYYRHFYMGLLREDGSPKRALERFADYAPELGICQWFHFEDHRLRDAVGWMRRLGVRHLRTGISWADFYRPNALAWLRALSTVPAFKKPSVRMSDASAPTRYTFDSTMP